MRSHQQSHRLVRAAAAALAVTALAATGVAPALAAFPGENGKFSFDSDRDGGDIDIWTMNPNGSNLTNLTADHDGFDGLSSWRADGRKLVFLSDRLTARNPEGDTEVFVMDADGSNQKQLTVNTLEDEFPAWSPDGKTILFSRDLNPIVGEIQEDIFTMRADGTNQQNRTRTSGINEFEATWSPDGQKIAFASDRDGDNEIYTMSPHGSNLRQLTVNVLNDEFPDWSPDSRLIAFNNSDPDDNFEIYTMRRNGSNLTRLGAPGAIPVWSPDGRKLAFGSDRDGSLDIFTMRANGRDQVNRTNNPAFDLAADWQPVRHHD